MEHKKKIILCGYHWAGCKALELLLAQGYEVFVYTHETSNSCPDLEGLCTKWGIPYSLEKIGTNNMPFVPDMICSIYYRYIIGKEVIDCVDGKIFNLHPALLPKYRGCSSLTWAMINGEKECGFTFHYVDSGCDTGCIILQKRIPIEDFDTQLTLYNRVMFESMHEFLTVCEKVLAGEPGQEQVGEPICYKRGCPYDGVIDLSWDDQKIERFIRAMIYPPYQPAEIMGQHFFTMKEYEAYRLAHMAD